MELLIQSLSLSSSCNNLSKHGVVCGDYGVQRMNADSSACLPANGFAELGVLCCRKRLLGQVLNVAPPKKEPRFTVNDDLPGRGDVACQERAAAGLGFEIDPCLPFRLRRHDHHIGKVEVIGDAFMLHPPCEGEPFMDQALPAGCLQALSKLPVSHDYVVKPRVLLESLLRGQNKIERALDFLQVGYMHNKNVVVLCAEFPEQRHVPRRGLEGGKVDGIGNDSYRGKLKRCELFLEMPGWRNQKVRQSELAKKGLRERLVESTAKDAVAPPAGKPENARDRVAPGERGYHAGKGLAACEDHVRAFARKKLRKDPQEFAAFVEAVVVRRGIIGCSLEIGDNVARHLHGRVAHGKVIAGPDCFRRHGRHGADAVPGFGETAHYESTRDGRASLVRWECSHIEYAEVLGISHVRSVECAKG